MKKNKITLTQYLAKHKLGILLYILVYLIAGACTIFTTLLFAEGIELLTDANYTKTLIILAIAAGLILLKRSCWYISGIIYQKVANAIMAELNYDLSRQAFKLNSKTYSDHNTGTFVQRLVSDPERVVSNLADLVDIITDILTSIIIVVYIATLNIYVGLIVFALIIVGIILEKIRVRVRVKNKRETRRKNDKVNALSTEIVRSEKDIKSLGLEEKLSEVAKVHYEDYKKSSYRTEMTDMTFWSFRNLLVELVGVGVLILGVYMIDKGLLTLASFMIIYSNNSNLYGFIWGFGNVMSIFGEVKVCTERMFALFNEEEFVTEKFGNVELENVKGEIEFKNVKYTFVEYEADETLNYSKMTPKELKALKKNKKERKIKSTNQIFSNLSFKIEPNTTVAFVGKSGSGKSTILNLMSKLYQVDDGAVTIDKVNINDLSKNTLRKTISLVNQFPYIFDMTIKENLLLAKKDATDEEIAEAIKKASLEEFIASLNDGIDTKVGESGIKLSGGQKQRLAIAR
ncbi:MAG: ABC transporter ATP-binding protein, partial [Clostridia bacterium]|nr:ABC transporter ATP-binding protein [Clostridia bacterium]